MQKLTLSSLMILSLLLSGACSPSLSDLPTVTPTAQYQPDTLLGTEMNAICSTVTEIPVDECKALGAVYIQTHGKSWNTNFESWIGRDLWFSTSQPCNWGGVTCQAGHISEIHWGP